MVHLIIAMRITADVSVTVLGGTPFLDGTCQMQGGILCRMGEGVGHFGDCLLYTSHCDTALSLLADTGQRTDSRNTVDVLFQRLGYLILDSVSYTHLDVYKRQGQHGWVYCMLLNFGGNIGLHGKMDALKMCIRDRYNWGLCIYRECRYYSGRWLEQVWKWR